jgi:hypothetical protein
MNNDGLKLKNMRSTRGREKSVAEALLALYRRQPNFPDAEDSLETKRHIRAM